MVTNKTLHGSAFRHKPRHAGSTRANIMYARIILSKRVESSQTCLPEGGHVASRGTATANLTSSPTIRFAVISHFFYFPKSFHRECMCIWESHVFLGLPILASPVAHAMALLNQRFVCVKFFSCSLEMVFGIKSVAAIVSAYHTTQPFVCTVSFQDFHTYSVWKCKLCWMLARRR